MSKIALLIGGDSAEREVSLASGKSIMSACKDLGHNVILLDPVDGFEKLIPKLTTVDLVFNALHGGDGENGLIAKKLENLKIPFTGSGSLSSSMCMNKAKSKRLLKDKGIYTANWILLSKDQDFSKDHLLNFPLVVKPNSEGSTIGLSIVKNNNQLKSAISHSKTFSKEVLIEEFIPGREITVAIVGSEAYPIVEIMPSHDFYDYECKYTNGMSEYACPADLSSELTKEIQNTALKIHSFLKCRHYSRIDFRLDLNDKACFLEVNNLPGMTGTSLVPRSASSINVNFNQLINKIINQVINNV